MSACVGIERDSSAGVVNLCEIGHLGVRADGTWSPIRGERARSAVAALSLHRADGVTTEALIDAVWPSPGEPPTARQSLANLVARLRSSHGDGFVETTPVGYRLGANVGSDRDRFVAAVDRATGLIEDAPQDALDTIEDAFVYVRGRPWHDVEFPLEVEADRARLLIDIQRARRIRARALAALGRHVEAIPEFEAVLADNPIDELSWFELATAHAASGTRVDALRTLRRARRHLGEHGLTLEPAAAELEQRLLAGTSLTARATAEFPATPTPLIGRSELLNHVLGLMSPGTAITLLGPAGIGKTRLAVELGRNASADRSYFIDLSAVLDDDLVASALIVALGVVVEPGATPIDALLDHLGTRDVLLVLDNCEQVASQVAELVASIVAACPSCTVVTTSRERLGSPTERVVRVDPLPTGPDGAGVELFFDRVQQLGVDLPPDVWRESAAELCEALDGLPLGIELAAARTSVLTPSEILAALADRFRVLKGPDGTGLDDAIRWSWDLLDETEREALRHLSVFHSGVALDTASKVWGLDRWAALDLAERLARKSLLEIRQSPSTPTRFEMLDSIRYFVIADAERSGIIGECRDRHLASIDFVTLRAHGKHGFRCDSGGMDDTDRERHEVRSALDHATSDPQQAATGAMICHRLFGWWRARGAAREGFERLATLLRIAQLGPDDRAAAMASLASLARIAAVPDRDVRSLGAEAERRLGELTPSQDRDRIELRLIEATFDDGDAELGARLRRLADMRTIGEDPTALHLLAAWTITNDPDRAPTVADEFLEFAASSGEPHDGHPREFQGLAALVAGDLTGAARHLADALELHLDSGKALCAVHCAEGVGWLAIEAGDIETGRSLLAATEGLRRSRRRSRAGFEEQAIAGALRRLGTLPAPALDADIDETIERARHVAGRLGPSRSHQV